MDRNILAVEVRRLIDEHGSQSGAARATGIQQSQLSRLANQRANEIGLKEFEKLGKQLDSSALKRLTPAFLSPEAQHRLRVYDAWLAAGLQSIDESVPRKTAERRLRNVVAKKFPALYARFLKRATEFGLDRKRLELAFFRVNEPLLNFSASGSVERDWRELSDDELYDFVDAGVTREIILMNRSTSFVRAQRPVRTAR